MLSIRFGCCLVTRNTMITFEEEQWWRHLIYSAKIIRLAHSNIRGLHSIPFSSIAHWSSQRGMRDERKCNWFLFNKILKDLNNCVNSDDKKQFFIAQLNQRIHWYQHVQLKWCAQIKVRITAGGSWAHYMSSLVYNLLDFC